MCGMIIHNGRATVLGKTYSSNLRELKENRWRIGIVATQVPIKEMLSLPGKSQS